MIKNNIQMILRNWTKTEAVRVFSLNILSIKTNYCIVDKVWPTFHLEDTKFYLGEVPK